MAEGNVPQSDSELWVPILSRAKLGPHRRHFFPLETKPDDVFNHVKVTVYPDGGIKRVRIIGMREVASSGPATATVVSADGVANTEERSAEDVKRIVHGVTMAKAIPVLPLTHEAFAPFGQVIQAYGDHAAAPRGTKITPANGGTASKFHKLALLHASYPEGAGATSGLSVYRCQPVAVTNGRVRLSVLERHPYTNQAFVPMGGGGIEGDEAIREPGNRYLVVVALNSLDDGPDLGTLRAFVASAGQGVVYETGIWRECFVGALSIAGLCSLDRSTYDGIGQGGWALHLIRFGVDPVDQVMDFTCIETQIGNGDKADCEVVELGEEKGVFELEIPN